MDNFKTIYIILDTLEKALDTGLDKNDISADRLGISQQRRDALLGMLQNEGYITGAKFTNFSGGKTNVRVDGIQITIKGLEYLENNTTMQKACRFLKGVKDTIPGL